MYYTYIIYDSKHSEFYIGVTLDLMRRRKIMYHQKPGCKIVYYEEFDNSEEATRRENILLNLSKSLLKELISENNPMWVDLMQ